MRAYAVPATVSSVGGACGFRLARPAVSGAQQTRKPPKQTSFGGFRVCSAELLERVAHRHQDALLLGEVLDAFGPVLAADAGALVAAERAAGIEGIPVDRVRPGANLLRDLDAVRHVGGPHAPGQAGHGT